MVVSSSVFYVASLGLYAFLHMTESSIWLFRHHTLFSYAAWESRGGKMSIMSRL